MSRNLSGSSTAPEHEIDRDLEQLLRLTKEALTEDTWPATEAELRRLHDRVAAPPPRLRWSAMAALILAVAAVPAAWVLLRRPVPLTFEVIHGTVGRSGEIRPLSSPASIDTGTRDTGTRDTGTRIRFSEGSEIVLDQEARTQVRDMTANGGRIVLTDGRAHTYFVPRPHARWQVAAGPYVVQVTGTVFDVEWSEEKQALDVWLRKGSVTVHGPLIGGGVAMTHGQHLLTRIRDNKIVLDSQSDVEAAAGPGPAEDAPPATGRSGSRDEGDLRAGLDGASVGSSSITAPAPGRRTGGMPDHLWSRHLARGDFEAVIAAAERRGIDGVLARGSRRELGALADAARYTRRGTLARRVLHAERSRFPESTEGREAAYFLGNLADDEGATRAAVTWFGRYLREDPSGTYASQALGRTMVLHARESGAQESSARARADAREYLARFPTGSYAEAARRIIKQR